MGFAIFLFVATLLSTSHANPRDVFNPNRLLRPHSATTGYRDEGLDCLSWRLAVETNNLQNWFVVPQSCQNYVEDYMLGKQYRHDCEVVTDAAIEYAKSLKLGDDGKNIWVFDVDETLLSNLPFFIRHGFGGILDAAAFFEWLEEGAAPSVPAAPRLYNTVLALGIKPVILTGAPERLRDTRTANLHKAGYYNWERLILRGEDDEGTTQVEYKSKRRTELVNEGYRIVGNTGDQWSDLLGSNVGNRTFKVPNPMYYAP